MELSVQQKKCILALNALKCLHKRQILQKELIRRKRKRFWVNPFLSKRGLHDLECHLLKDLLWENGDDYKKFCRMTIQSFEDILALVSVNNTIIICTCRYIYLI